ncbi:hypothetical protein B0T22DRAFT_455554 [Podospora appendiculata]|uniref:DNA polymerase n=1 Tax=Podospora appendiculata TaxID=314037 RepID=A0AAE0XMD9_9PEZI|nr:hypothetical protein B0T22DRAFT_455554 [Podospora appendiculata]
MDVFRVRLNCVDHYQARPTRYDPQLRRDVRVSQVGKEPKVPVVRVFGSTETGQKVCAHIHGAFPYLYVEYNGGLSKAEVSQYTLRLHLSIDHALAVSYRKDAHRDRPKYVARITLAKGVPFYGYHVGYRFYLKIYMLEPHAMTRLADLLQQGVIMSQKFQPYEAHLQYLLQFMADFNLYGCNYIEASKVSFRSPVPEHDDGNGEEVSVRMWNSRTIPRVCITDDQSLLRVSHCALEVDICVQDIVNRKAIKERRLHHDFIERKHPLPADLKLVPSMAGLWKDESRRRKKLMHNPPPGSSPFPPDALVSMSADARYSQPFGWIHEEECREQIRLLADREQSTVDGEDISFSNYVKPVPLEDTINTLLQSVEDLFPENLLPALGLEERLLDMKANMASSIDVDEKGILAFGIGQEAKQPFPDDLDDDAVREPKEVDEFVAGNEPPEVVVEGIRTTTMPPHPIDEFSVMRNSIPTTDKKLIRTINGLGGGVTVSGLRTKSRPYVPLRDELVLEAQRLEIFTAVKEIGVLIPGEPTPSKRPQSASENDVPVKRRRLDIRGETDETAMVASSLPIGFELKSERLKGEPTSLSQPSDPVRPTLKGGLAKQSGNQILNFPVVKDPNSINTKTRLSQQGVSQRGEDDTMKKHVSFDPRVSIQEAASHEGSSLKGPAPRTPSHKPKTGDRTSSPRLLWAGSTRMFIVNSAPPSLDEVRSTMQSNGLPDVIYQDAFYSDDKDVPPRPREYAGREFRLDGNTVPYLPDFDATGESPATFGVKPEVAPDISKTELAYERQRAQCTLRSWEIAQPPPTFEEVSNWCTEKEMKQKAHLLDPAKHPAGTRSERSKLSQIVGATPKNKHGFKYSPKKTSTSVQHEAQYMSTMSIEVHVNTRGKLVPNPEEDEVQCVFWCLRSDENSMRSSQPPDNTQTGVVVLSEDGHLAERIRKQTTMDVVEESSELDVMVKMVEVVRVCDPDILTGYEVHGSSWGYLIERARFKYDYNLCDEFSRMKSDSKGRSGKEADRWGFNTTSTIRVTGRHMVNIWRAMRGELNLLQYSMENVVWHLLHRRIPHYSWRTLSDWYISGRPGDLSKVLRYYLKRTRLDIEILESNELIARTSEQARLLGVDFFSVFSRGSQFKVESIMFRIAKPENFILPSPSRKQVGGQNALECLPLVMEPQSAFYSSPLLVLDFQSLYPSVVIAYNYCYSTFLGRIVNWRGTNKMGFTEYKRREGLLRLLKDHINIAPNGVMYAKTEVRKSLLAKMLTEILETRVMVKSGMKQDKDDKPLQQLLNNRQLALKLLANVTYGYASASFSGRMPCSEIADSIVQTGRETLERAIAYIHSVERWGAEVVYGDTDSLFIYLKGRTREQAFDIGAEMAEAITHQNPRPIKLKFEKVYHPCVLLAKKRYVGYKFESRDQPIPDFDAKGIETVRRDGTPAEQKIEEKALKILFDTADLSQVKAYFQAQCAKIMRGSVSVQDFCFAKEVRLGTYSAKGPGPPGALVSARRMVEDARAEPQYGERVPYVVVSGAPGARLVDRCVAPEELLNSSHASIDAEYYISKNIIPPLERIFNLVGANVRAWFDEMPKVHLVKKVDNFEAAPAAGIGMGMGMGGQKKKATLEWFLHSASCVACGVKMKNPTAAAGPAVAYQAADVSLPICGRCAADVQGSVALLQSRLNAEQRGYADVVKVCQGCAGLAPLEGVECDSKDCPVFYTRVKQGTKLRAERAVVEPLVRHLAGLGLGRQGLDW